MGGVKTTASMGAEGQSTTWSYHPDKLQIPEKGSRLYDAERNKNVSESFIKDIMRRGVQEPVLIRKNGDGYEVIDGRQRVLAAREGNRRFAEEGIDRVILVPACTRKADDALAYAIMIATNVHRRPETPMGLARKLQEYLALGNSEDDAAIDFGVDVATIKRWSKLLDLDTEVQQALDADRISTAAALDLVSLKRDEQRTELAKMIANGTTHGAAGKHAARAAVAKNGASNGRKPPVRKPMRSRRFVARILKVMDDMPVSKAPAQMQAVRDILNYVLEEIGTEEIESSLAKEIILAAEKSGAEKNEK